MTFATPRKRKAGASVVSEPIISDDGSEPEFEQIDWREDDLVMGPTPQLHGRVIGLFDTLSPIKLTSSQSVSDAAVPTPKARKIKSPLKTPTFLKRVSVNIHDGGDDDEEGAKPRLLFPALPKRGLSILINELRAMEDAEEDEGLSVLREMESDMFPIIHHDSKPTTTTSSSTTTCQTGIETGSGRTSRVGSEMTGTLQGDRDENEDPNGGEKVKWKKKGLKRSHRRVIMRPATTKKPSNGVSTATGDGAGDGDGVGEEDDDSDEYVNSEDEAADLAAAMNPPAKQTRTGNDPVNGSKQNKTSKKDGTEKYAGTARKAGGVSHNYKSLKLRNSGAKGGSRFGRGKFGGRR